MGEQLTLDRFEYKLPKDMYVVYKESIGFKYRMKNSNHEFDTEEDIQNFIEDVLVERKRYMQLVKTLSEKELKKLFSNLGLIKLTPKQINEYTSIELFEYTLVIGEDWGNCHIFRSLDELKDYVADNVGLNFNNCLTLYSDNSDGEPLFIEDKQ